VKDVGDEYALLEANTLALLNKMIQDALESGGVPSASLLGQAVSLLRAGQVPASSTAGSRSKQDSSTGWFEDLPDAAKRKLGKLELPPRPEPRVAELDDIEPE